MTSPADQEARLLALSPMESFAVAAPAGSGKTGLLTQRVLQLLAHCEQPEEILCITFTRKAAAEMQQRITEAITAAADGNNEEGSLSPHQHETSTHEHDISPHEQEIPSGEHQSAIPALSPHERKTRELALAVLRRDRQQGWNLPLAPNRLRVQTIDGLCRGLVRQMPLASGLGAVPDPLEQPEAAYRQAIRETLGLLERDSPLQADLRLLLRHLDNHLENVEALLLELLAKRDQWLSPLLATRDARHYLEQVLETLVAETLAETRARFASLGGELAALADYAAGNLAAQNIDSPLRHCAGLTALPAADESGYAHWEGLLELLLTQKNTWRGKLDKRNGFPAGNNKAEKARARQYKERIGHLIEELRAAPGLLEQLQLVRRLPPVRYSEPQWRLLDSLTRLLPVLAAQLKLAFGQSGAADFIEINQAALLALGREDAPSDLALKLDYRIRHILVDEFQDTSSPQLQLLEKLTAGWQPGDGRTLFIVGDGMQSCYGFRNANVGIFLDARRHGIAGLPLRALDLRVNFRSHGGVVDWINRVFARAFPARSDINRGAVSYAPSLAFKAAVAERPVAVIGCLETRDRRLEAAKVVQLVRDHQRRDPAGSIAVLVRNRTHLSEILNALRSAGIPWQSTDIDPLASRMAIVDAMSLTRALLDPTDRAAWLSVLRAPWCGLDMHDLYHLANTDLGERNPRPRHSDYPPLWPQILHSDRIAALSLAGRRNLTRLREVLEPAWRQRRRKPLRYWLEGVWLALGGPAALVDSVDRDNMPRYFDLLQRCEQGGAIADWEAFEQAVARLYAVPGVEAADAVQVMTIHKSKGLEFDTVIIPGLDRLPRADQHALLLWQEQITLAGDKQLLLGPLSATGDEQDPLYHYLSEERKLRGQLEANRLLYVGCTRAIGHLYLLAKLQTGEDGALKPPPPQSLLACIWSAVESEVELVRDTGEAPDRDIPQPEAAHPDTQRISMDNTAGPQADPLSMDNTTNLQADLFSAQDGNTGDSEPQDTGNRARPENRDSEIRNIQGESEAPVHTHILRLCPSWTAPPLAPDTTLLHYRGHEYDDAENLPSPNGFTHRVARHAGTVIHRALQAVALAGCEQWTPSRLEEQRPFWRQQLRQLGVFGPALGDCVDKVHKAVRLTLEDDTGRWILDRRHPHSACELAIGQTLARNATTEIRQSIIDRTFVDGGCRWVIDYKSSEPAPGQALDDFLGGEARSYAPQLQRYAGLFQQLGPEPVRTGLYFPLLRIFHEVPNPLQN